MNPLAAIAIAFGAIWLVNLAIQGGSASSLNFTISNAALGASGLNATIQLTVDVQNPSNAAYIIKSLVGNFYINGTLTGNVSSFNQFTINPNSETPISLNVLLQPGAVVSDIVNLFNGSQNVNMRLTGTANAGISIPFDIQYTLI